MLLYKATEGSLVNMEMLNYGDIDYWKILELPSVDKNHAVSPDMTIAYIKYAFINRFAIVKALINRGDTQYDYSSLLDIANAYLNLGNPLDFYKYNCYRMGESAYDTPDKYYGYDYLFEHDLDDKDNAIFKEYIVKELAYFRRFIVEYQLNESNREPYRTKNIRDIETLINALKAIGDSLQNQKNQSEEAKLALTDSSKKNK